MPDDSRELRSEDAFDVEALHAWLSPRVGGLSTVPEVRQFPGGASNLTYLLRYPDRELVLRRPPVGHKAASAHDMRREHRVQSSLAPWFPYVPAMIGFCDDPAVLGSDFYVMSKVDGTILRGRSVTMPVGDAVALGDTFVDTLVALHGVDIEAAGLSDLGRGAGYVRRQVNGWNGRFAAARTPDVPPFTDVMAWLSAHQPSDTSMSLVHNDFRLDNLVLDDRLSVVAVLDWEMATIGDPLMDLGGALAYWVQADDDEFMRLSKRQPTDLPGMPTRAQVVERYLAATGHHVDDWAFYEVFGLFRLAAIAQQIYLRFSRGETTNAAFKDFHHFVTYLESRCRRVAGLG